ncbi:predicted protein [Lichtheimia corymbifera JMRC:FSU:9682]|uniref:Galactose oxidase n=1 Tax=Lichtheimia corymbifera JMRC:FSU:9682 TaxID=1263082 RepID=A0A068S2P4_9FUNG|nr:predicted protein [Lichtheimia corymbifera JMRC:FSU:9682]
MILTRLIAWTYLYFLSATAFVHAAYNLSEDIELGFPSVRPFSQVGAATFVRDDVLYTIGGISQYVNMTQPTTNFIAFHLSRQDGTIMPNPFLGMGGMPGLAYAQAVLLPDNDRVLMFGGNNDDMLDNNGTLVVREYRFSTEMWRELNVTAANGTLPQNRYKHTATLAPNGKIYIYGGQVPGSPTEFFIDFWEYDPVMNRFTEIQIDHNPLSTIQPAAIMLP